MPNTQLTASRRSSPVVVAALQDAAVLQIGDALDACLTALIEPWYKSLSPDELQEVVSTVLIRFSPGEYQLQPY